MQKHKNNLERTTIISVLALFKKYKELILYVIVGGITTVVSIGTYELSMRMLHLDALLANVISWIAAVTFAYFTNRNIVFAKTEESVLKQAIKFFGGRVGTLLMEEVLLWLMIFVICINASIAKIIAQIFVFVANYIVSKLFVFKK